MSLGSCYQILSRSFEGSWLTMRGKLVVGGFGSFWNPGSDGFEDVFASRQGVSFTRGLTLMSCWSWGLRPRSVFC